MSTELTKAANAPDGTFIWARLGSLVAVLPLGAWTVLHIWENLAAFRGAQAWEESVTHYGHPLAHFATMIVVLVPLVMHTAWGISRISTARPNNLTYSFFGNTKYILQRLSAIGVMLFLGAHIFKAMIQPRVLENHAETFANISTTMAHHMPTLIVYLLGTLGVAYHFANGLYSFGMGWGICVSRRALKNLEIVSYGVFVVLLGMCWAVIAAMYRQGR